MGSGRAPQHAKNRWDCIMNMNEQAADDTTVPSQTQKGARDLLSKLYREIGISAVAAALEAKKTHHEAAEEPRNLDLPHNFTDEEAA
jgi:hypothetical protein